MLALQIRVGDPTGLCAAPSDVHPKVVVNRELQEIFQRWQADTLKAVAEKERTIAELNMHLLAT